MGDNPYARITENAQTRKCDLIVMASHGGRGFDAVVLGSETVKVLTHSKAPCWLSVDSDSRECLV